MENQLFNFAEMTTAGTKTAKTIARTFERYGAEVAGPPVIDPRIRRTAGISYREVTILFKDSQKVVLRVKASGDIYQVLMNGRDLPIKHQDSQKLAIRDIVDGLNARRAAFQKRLAQVRVPIKDRGLSVTKRMQVEKLKARSANLSEAIVAAEEELRVLANGGIEPAAADAQPAPAAAEKIDPTTADGYAKVIFSDTLQEQYQDILDAHFQGRIIDVRNALRAQGWEGAPFAQTLTKGNQTISFRFKHVGAGRNIVGYWAQLNNRGNDEWRDDLTMNATEFAKYLDDSFGKPASAEPAGEAEPAPAEAQPEPEVGDVVFVVGGKYNGTIRTLLKKPARQFDGYEVSDTIHGSINVPGVRFYRRPEQAPATAPAAEPAPQQTPVQRMAAEIAALFNAREFDKARDRQAELISANKLKVGEVAALSDAFHRAADPLLQAEYAGMIAGGAGLARELPLSMEDGSDKAKAWLVGYDAKAKPAATAGATPEAAEQLAGEQRYIVKDAAAHAEVPGFIRQRLDRADQKGEVAILSFGVSRKYSLYESGERTEFDAGGARVVGSASSNDVVAVATRYQGEDRIVAMTSAAENALAERREAYEAARKADKEAAAVREAERRAADEKREALKGALAGAKFKKASLTAGKTTVEGWENGGVIAHKSINSPGLFAVSHLKTGAMMVDKVPTLGMAKMIAARLARTADMTTLTVEKAKDDAFAKLRSVVNAIKATAVPVGVALSNGTRDAGQIQDPYAGAELDAPEPSAEPAAAAEPAEPAPPAVDEAELAWLRSVADGATDVTGDLRGARDRIRKAQKVPELAEVATLAARALAAAAVAQAKRIVAAGGDPLMDSALADDPALGDPPAEPKLDAASEAAGDAKPEDYCDACDSKKVDGKCECDGEHEGDEKDEEAEEAADAD